MLRKFSINSALTLSLAFGGLGFMAGHADAQSEEVRRDPGRPDKKDCNETCDDRHNDCHLACNHFEKGSKDRKKCKDFCIESAKECHSWCPKSK